MYGGCWVEKGWERGGGEKRGDEIHRREPVRRKKREKGQDIVGGSRGGRILKRVKRAAAKQRESEAAVE